MARSYDSAGNTLSIGGTAREFVYSNASRMQQVKQGGVVAMREGRQVAAEMTERLRAAANALRPMHLIARFAALVCCAAALMGCGPRPDPQSEQSASPSASMHLDQAQLEEMQLKAKRGDVDAMRRIAAHYDFGVSDSRRAIPWLEMAAEHGSPSAMRALAIHLSVRAQGDDCRRADALFRKALSVSADAGGKAKIQVSYRSFLSGRAAGRCGPQGNAR